MGAFASSIGATGGTLAPPADEDPSIGGFLGNIVGGLEGLVTGVGQLGGSVLHDIAKVGTEALTFGKADWGGGYQSPTIAKALPGAIAEDFSTRYGPLFRGDLGAFAEQIYEQPVSFGLDALTVASAGAKVAGVAGGATAKAAEAAGFIPDVTKVISRESLENANVATRTAKAASLRSTLDALGEAGYDLGISGTLKKMLPAPKYVRKGDLLKLSAETYNPLTRFVTGQTFGRLTSQSVAQLESNITRALAEATTDAQYNKVKLVQNLLADAKEKGRLLGIPEDKLKIETERMGEFRASQAGRAIDRFSSGAFFRDKMKAIKEDKDAWVAAKPAIMPEEWNAMTELLTNTDVGFIDAPLDAKIAARAEKRMGTKLMGAELSGPIARLKNAAEDLTPDVLSKLEGTAALTRGQEILAALDDLKQRLVENQAVIEAANPNYDIAAQIKGVDQMTHDVVHGLQKTADPTSPRWLIEKEAQRQRDISRLMPGWEHYDPNSMPLQVVQEAERAAQFMHGAEPVVGIPEPATVGAGEQAFKMTPPDVVTGPTWDEYANAWRRMDRESPIYFPFIDETKTGGWDFSLVKKRKGAIKFAKDPHENFNSGKLFKNGGYLTDPAEAYAIRASRGVRMNSTARMINAYAEQGREITSPDQLATGEVIIAPALTNIRAQVSGKYRNTVEDLMMNGASEEEAKIAALAQVGNEVVDNITGKLSTEGGLKMYAVPEATAKHMNDAAKWAGLVPTGAKIYLGGPMNVWRSLVLAGSPRWLVNNILGNGVFLTMQGASITKAMHLLEQRYKNILAERFPAFDAFLKSTNLRDTKLLDAIDRHMMENGLYDEIAGGTFVRTDAMNPALGANAELTRGGQIIKKSREAPGRVLHRFQKIGGGVRNLNSELEAAARRSSYITAVERVKGVSAMKRTLGRFDHSTGRIEKMLKDGLTEGEGKAVLNEVNHFLGDFSNLGPVERNIIRPYIVPFWGFYKFQAKLFLSYPFEYPLRAQVLAGLANVTKDLSDAYGPRPEWLKGGIPLGPPGAGELTFLTTAGPNPFAGLFQNPLGQLSPLVKIPAEMALGRSLFTGKQFSDKDVVTPFGTDQQFRIIRNSEGQVTDVEPITKVSPGILESILGQIPQYNLIKDQIAGGATFDTATIIDAMKGKAALKSPEGEIKYPVTLLQQIGRYVGFPTTQYDLGAFQTYLAEQKQAALTEAQNRG